MPSVTISSSAPRTIKRQYALSLPTKRAVPVPGGPADDALGTTGTAGTLERGPAASSAVIHLPMKESRLNPSHHRGERTAEPALDAPHRPPVRMFFFPCVQCS